MKTLPFALIAGALLLTHASLAQTTAAPSSQSSATPATPAKDAGPPTAAKPAPGDTTAAKPATREIAVSNLTNKDLVGQNNSNLGDIERVVESTTDKKSYVVVSRGGLLGFFETEYLVPVDKITIASDRVIAKSMTQAQLESSGKFVAGDAYHVLDGTQTISVSAPH